MSEELRNRVRQVIADEFGQKVEDVTDDKEFVDDLFADSLDSINLACVLEDTFDIEVSQLDARKRWLQSAMRALTSNGRWRRKCEGKL